MAEKCPKRWQAECPNRGTKLGCFLVEHHICYISGKYKTPLEQEYRELPSNKVNMCRYVESELHEAEPAGPPIPSIELMQYCVDREAEKRWLGSQKP